jgi:hypothetical protein
MSKPASNDNLAELVRKNTTEAQWETLHEMGVIADNGHLNISVANLQTAEEAGLPMGEQKAVRIKGQVKANIHYNAAQITLLKNKGGQISAISNQRVLDRNGNTVISTKTGKPFIKYIPDFSSVTDPEKRTAVVDAWRAFLGILPSYLSASGDL